MIPSSYPLLRPDPEQQGLLVRALHDDWVPTASLEAEALRSPEREPGARTQNGGQGVGVHPKKGL